LTLATRQTSDPKNVPDSFVCRWNSARPVNDDGFRGNDGEVTAIVRTYQPAGRRAMPATLAVADHENYDDRVTVHGRNGES